MSWRTFTESKNAFNKLSESIGLDIIKDEAPDGQQRRIWVKVMNLLAEANQGC